MNITGKTRVVGVWGCPVGHSRSPVMQNAAIAALGLDWVYVPFEVSPDPANVKRAVEAIRALNLVGVNVTVPLKELVGEYLDVIDPDAAKIGSVNTIVNDNGRLTGYSTDGQGFLLDLKRRHVTPDNLPALVWGAGGSARAVAFALAGAGCTVTIANRTRERAEQLAAALGPAASAVGYDDADYAARVRDAQLLVNATSLGMAPAHTESMPPVPEGALHEGQVVYDLVYVPERTRLIETAEQAGCRAIGGIGMLACQGAVALSLFSGLPLAEIPTDVFFSALGVQI